MGEESNRDLVHQHGVSSPPVASPGPGFELVPPGGPEILKERKACVLLLAFARTKPLWRHMVSHVTYEIIANSPLKMT